LLEEPYALERLFLAFSTVRLDGGFWIKFLLILNFLAKFFVDSPVLGFIGRVLPFYEGDRFKKDLEGTDLEVSP
jgi:hypothetical protein